MSAAIIDGKAIAAAVRAQVAAEVADLAARGIKPGLAVVLVGEDPASQTYVRNKEKQAVAAGMHSEVHRMSADVSTADVLARVAALNRATQIHGILVQLPLPDQVDEQQVLEAIRPEKDVDGFHPVNVGRLHSGGNPLLPCTPAGCMELIDSTGVALKGAEAVVVGRSNIVGKPMAALLLRRHCTVTVCHSRTRDLAAHTRAADVLIAAVGRAKMITGEMIKPGAVVIDVGINRDAEGKLVGDVDFAGAAAVAGHITPVPGGVGPMTIAMLLKNTVEAARRTAGR